ncbi:MAG: PAS domain S-box protein [Candidatus Saccharicenans sp.]|uniref:PAS domain S-box protein n=1 Tax=Candidatus Saccharicenans sp. TaxID=2819258 RepID=UPI00404A8587
MLQPKLADRAPGKKLWTIGFIFLFLILLTGGYFLLWQETRTIFLELSRDLSTISGLKAEGVKQWRQERLNDAANISASPIFLGAFSQWLGRPDDLELKGNLVNHLSLASRIYGYENIFVVDNEGQVLLCLEDGAEVVSLETGRSLKQAFDSKKSLLSALQQDKSGHIFLDSVSPIISRDGSVLGALILRSNASLFLFPFLKSWPTPSRTAEIMLVRRQDEQVFYLNQLRHRDQGAFSPGPSLSRVSLPAVRAVLGQVGVFEGEDYRGIRVLADVRPVPESSWFIVTKIDVAEIRTEARSRSVRTMVILGLLIIIAAGLAFIGYRQKIIAYLRALYRAEKAKRETQEEFRTILYSIGDAVMTTDREGRIKLMNPMAEKLTGWKEDEAWGKPLSEVFNIINEETRASGEDPVSRVLRIGTTVGLANHTLLISRDGQEIPIADAGAPIRDEYGRISGVVLVFRDQTKERAARQALEESEERYRVVVENSHAGVLIVNQNYQFEYVNQRLCEILGQTQAEILGHDFREFLDEEFRALVTERYLRRQRGEDVPSRYEFNIIRKDGEKRRIEISSAIVRDLQGRIITVGQLLDITERKQAEEALRASEEKYRILHEFAGEAIFTYTLDLKLLEVNRAACDYVGLSREELLGRDVLELDILHPDDIQRAIDNLRRITEGGQKITVDKLRFRGKDGTYATYLVTSTPIVRNGEIVAITNVCRDITLEQKLHAELEASEKKYRFLFNAGNDAIFVYRLTGDGHPSRFVEANELACRLSGYTREELMALTPADLVVPEERADVIQSNLEIVQKKQRIFERTFLTKDGRRISCEISSHFFEMDNCPTVLAIARDITERNKTKESLQIALKEKEVMLREIHHRVKNNLQVISSLLRLQAAQLTDKHSREAFIKSQNRIRSMAMIHEKLYQSGNLASVDFADYVEKLVTHLYVVYDVDQSRVLFRNEVEEIGLDINKAIPCGLIVNELVSNALKYAFMGNAKGELIVKMSRDESGRNHLVVKDTGQALPAEIDIHRSETLGFQIINDLTKQLNGALEYRRDGGNEFKITI